MLKNIWILIIIILFAFFVRIILLNEVPPGLANDELNIILNAQSLLKTGQNIPGVVTGILGNPKGDLSGGIHSEVSSYFLIPFIFITGFNWPFIKLFFIVISIGTIVLSYLLVSKIINKETGLISAVLLTINPWSIHFARSAFESSVSCFFYLLSIYLIISKKRWKIFWALPFLILGFLSYFSAKTLLLPIGLISILAVWFHRPKESLKPILLLNLLLVLFVILYSYLLILNPSGSRLNELQSDQQIQKIVIDKRTKSINLPISNLFENKYFEDISIRLSKALSGLSARFLFLDGQEGNNPALSTPEQSPLYIIDLPLIVAGLIFLSRFNLPILVFLISLITITLIPNFLNLAGTTFMIRTVILVPLLTFFSASGIFYILKSLNKILKIIAAVLILGIYIFLFGNFIYRYFSRLPVDRAEGWFLHQRVADRYIKEQINQNPIVVIDSNPKHFFYRYIFFNGLYTNPQTISEINQRLESMNYQLGNVSVTSKCPKNYDNSVTYLIDQSLNCLSSKGMYISNIRDGGDEYLILNDKICNLYVNKTYPLIKEYKYLDIEHLGEEEFCNNFVTIHGS